MATQMQIAAHLDLGDRQIRNLVKEGVLPAAKGPGGMDLDACRYAYIHYLRHQANHAHLPKTSEPLAETTLEYERYRLTKEQATGEQLKNQARERENELEEGKLVTRHDHHQELVKMAKAVITPLETLPDVLERSCGLSPQAVMKVQTLVDDIRNQMAQAIIDADEHGAKES